LLGLTALAVLVGGAGLATAGGGRVLPANASPHGYTLDDMAEALAYFSTSGNDPRYYPDTPFQILYTTESNTFTAETDTMFFVPLFFADDSPPILGDFPAGVGAVEDYVFGEGELGAYDVEIEVDGVVTKLGPAYVAGPVFTPGLPDGGGSHFIQLGVFLTPLFRGEHQVTYRASFGGEAVLEAFGGPVTFEGTYTVVVE
jgi:hypothetical protein